MRRESMTGTEPIRILIADDHTLMREGPQTILETQPDLRVVGLAATGAEAVVQVLMLSAFDDDTYVIESLKAGAAGYLLKDFPSEELITAIRTVHHLPFVRTRNPAVILPSVSGPWCGRHTPYGGTRGSPF